MTNLEPRSRLCLSSTESEDLCTFESENGFFKLFATSGELKKIISSKLVNQGRWCRLAKSPLKNFPQPSNCREHRMLQLNSFLWQDDYDEVLHQVNNVQIELRSKLLSSIHHLRKTLMLTANQALSLSFAPSNRLVKRRRRY